MFSNDRNIETIGQLVETLKHYIGLQSKHMKLDIIDKVVQVLTVLTMTFVLLLLFLLAIIYLSFAVAYALASVIGTATAFACVAGIYFFVLFLFVIFRKKWIERPLVKLLANILIQE